MGMVEDLINNRYLITPSAYYLLEGPYERGDFNLVDLIKFAKSKDAFVITPDIAEEFLKLVSPPRVPAADQEVSPETAPRSESGSEVGGSSTKTETIETVTDESVGEAEGTGVDVGDTSVPGYHGGGYEGHVAPEPVESVEFESSEFSESMESIEPTEPELTEPLDYSEEIPPDNGRTYTLYEDVRISSKPSFHFKSAEIPDDYAVKFDVRQFSLSPPPVKNGRGKEGEVLVEAYRSYFRSRLRKMRRILRENPDVGGVIDIGKLSYLNPKEEVTVVGMVTEKHESRKGHVLEIEDSTGRVKVFIGRDREDHRKVMEIPKDAVIAVRGRYSRRMMFASRIYIPDVPKFRRPKEPLKERVYAVLTSDLHVGSKKFCETAFEKFLEWLNGDVEDESQADLVSRIKYVIIDGDAVDGVGIYPGQYQELAIPDIFDQYEALANLLSNVPKHITVFIGPGNHDAARAALPQPGFYEEYVRPLMKVKNVVIISNPAVIDLHGREFLIYHGRGIEDVVNEIPNRSHHRPAEASLDLLKLRHLAPTFGEKVPIAPDPDDLLVIESVPDLFQTGHVHVMEYRLYNGVFVINSGTWQAQTEFQKMVNIVPTPARVPVIDVSTAKLRAVVSFDRYCGEA